MRVVSELSHGASIQRAWGVSTCVSLSLISGLACADLIVRSSMERFSQPWIVAVSVKRGTGQLMFGHGQQRMTQIPQQERRGQEPV